MMMCVDLLHHCYSGIESQGVRIAGVMESSWNLCVKGYNHATSTFGYLQVYSTRNRPTAGACKMSLENIILKGRFQV